MSLFPNYQEPALETSGNKNTNGELRDSFLSENHESLDEQTILTGKLRRKNNQSVVELTEEATGECHAEDVIGTQEEILAQEAEMIFVSRSFENEPKAQPRVRKTSLLHKINPLYGYIKIRKKLEAGRKMSEPTMSKEEGESTANYGNKDKKILKSTVQGEESGKEYCSHLQNSKDCQSFDITSDNDVPNAGDASINVTADRVQPTEDGNEQNQLRSGLRKISLTASPILPRFHMNGTSEESVNVL